MIETRIKVDDLSGKAIGTRLDDPDDWNGELTKDMLWDIYQELKKRVQND